MSGFCDANGLLKSAYSLSSIVTRTGEISELSVTDDMSSFLFFQFQDKKFRFTDAVKLLGEGIEVEVLPGIYFGKAEKSSILKRLLYTLIRRKFFIIRNENKKDYFQICSELEEETKPAFHGGKIISTQLEFVNPQNVEQPENLGGGKCGGCKVYSYFSGIDLLGERDIDGYYFFSDKEVLEATKQEPFFLERCKHNGCFETYNRILEEGYSEKLEQRDQIKVTYKNARYSVGEGKHRVCTMKRFGYSQEIPMEVTRVEETRETSDVSSLFHKDYFSDIKHVLESCYNQYERIGIAADDVKRLLKDPHSNVLDYLKSSRYSSYQEIFDNYRKKRQDHFSPLLIEQEESSC